MIAFHLVPLFVVWIFDRLKISTQIPEGGAFPCRWISAGHLERANRDEYVVLALPFYSHEIRQDSQVLEERQMILIWYAESGYRFEWRRL